MFRWFRVAVVPTALVAACTSGSPGDPSPSASSVGPPVSRPSASPAECDGAPRATCGTVEVPLDRSDPSAGTIRIGYELHPHTDRTEDPLDPIVAAEGGPGYATKASRGS